MTSNIKGYCYAMGYSILTAITMMSIHHMNKTISPLISTGIIFSIAILFFNIVNKKQWKFTYKTLFSFKKQFFFMNFFTAVNWLTTFFAMLYFNPLLFITIFMASLPIATCIVGYLWKGKPIHQIHIVTGIAIILLISVLVKVGLSPGEYVLSYSFLMGLLLTVTSAFAGACYLYQSRQIQEEQLFSPIQILSVRFYLLVGICAIAAAILPHQALHLPTFFDLSRLVVLAFFSSILPLFFMQKGISVLGSMRMSFLMPSTLVFTYAFLCMKGIEMNGLIPCVVVSLAVLLSLYPYLESKSIAKMESC